MHLGKSFASGRGYAKVSVAVLAWRDRWGRLLCFSLTGEAVARKTQAAGMGGSLDPLCSPVGGSLNTHKGQKWSFLPEGVAKNDGLNKEQDAEDTGRRVHMRASG